MSLILNFQTLWEKIVASHQDNSMSIGDAYRLKWLLSESLLDSVTLRREGDTVVLEVEVAGRKTIIIREHISNNFYSLVTADGILEAFGVVIDGVTQ